MTKRSKTSASSTGSLSDGALDDDDFDCDSFEDGCSNSRMSGGDEKTTKDEKRQLAQQETLQVFRLRMLVFCVLFIATVAVSAAVYYITTDAEKELANNQFTSAADKVTDAFIDIVKSRLPAVSSIGVAAIAHGVDHYRDWPFVTLSSFQQRSSTARSLSKALAVYFCPYVTDEDRKEWEEFVIHEHHYM